MGPCRIAISTTALAGKDSRWRAPGVLQPRVASRLYRAIQGVWESGGSDRTGTYRMQIGITVGAVSVPHPQTRGINGNSLRLEALRRPVRSRRYRAAPIQLSWFGLRLTGICRMP